MNILKKAYDSIKQTIEFEIFKRKFNNWLETKEIEILEENNRSDTKIIECLSDGRLGSAFSYFRNKTDREYELQVLRDYKNYVLKKIKDGN